MRKKNETDGGRDKEKDEHSGKEKWNLGREKRERDGEMQIIR